MINYSNLSYLEESYNLYKVTYPLFYRFKLVQSHIFSLSLNWLFLKQNLVLYRILLLYYIALVYPVFIYQSFRLLCYLMLFSLFFIHLLEKVQNLGPYFLSILSFRANQTLKLIFLLSIIISCYLLLENAKTNLDYLRFNFP